MRLTSDLFVAALVRRVFGTGGFAAVARRGALEAGAIFVILRDRSGELTLFGPAPQTDYAEGRPDDRRFQELARTGDEQTVAARMEKEARFDSDVWLVEMELSGQAAEDFFAVTRPSG